MDLKSKLAMYKKNHSEKQQMPQKPDEGIQVIPGGEVYSNDMGSCAVFENLYPLTYSHGGYRLGDALDIDAASFKRLCKEMDCDSGLHDLVFLDTETTGLSGGAGTVAFLVGIGYFTPNAFIMKQYFMRDYNEEPCILAALNSILSSRKGLVTFNGKAFDWNLLQSRFTFNRLRPVLSEPIHLDLLYPSRKIWKCKLESCRLSSLEEHILGETRTDDIPGMMIPSIYFKYLENRDTVEIRKVIKHNEQDILSMVSLLIKITNMLENPMAETDREQELLGTGRIFEASGDSSTVIQCYEACLKSNDFLVRETASKRLINIYKRSKDYEKAAGHCEAMLAGWGDRSITLMIELAKHHEHRTKDIEKALELVERAMELSRKMGTQYGLHYGELKKRLERLKRKYYKKA